MFTRCPNCDTHFEITQEYLDAAHGKVRCGQCNHVFNALDNLYESEEKAIENESKKTDAVDVKGEHNNENEAGITTEYNIESNNKDEDDFEIIDYYAEEYDNEQPHPLIDANTSKANTADMDVLNSLMEAPQEDDFDAFNEETIDTETEVDDKLLDNLDSRSKNIPDSITSLDDELSSMDDDLDELSSMDDDLDELDDGDDLLAELDQIEHDFLDKEKHSRQDSTQENPDPAPSYMDDTPSALSDNADSAAYATNKEEVVPSFLTQKDTPQSNPTAVFAWLTATIVFLFLLAGQYLYFNSKDFAQNPQMHAVIEPFCQLTGCTLPLIKTPRKIVTVTHDVRTFGAINNALEIQLTFKNKASYTQSYPLLEITFLNPVGNVVARRKFSPGEYMSSSDNYAQGLKSNQSQDINLKIIDPDPTSLLSFQFNYL